MYKKKIKTIKKVLLLLNFLEKNVKIKIVVGFYSVIKITLK